VLVPVAELLPSLVGHKKVSRVSLPLLAVILASHNKILEDFPVEWGELLNILGHAFISIVCVHNGVQFEFYTMCLTPSRNLE
jgi:hypothetical protein